VKQLLGIVDRIAKPFSPVHRLVFPHFINLLRHLRRGAPTKRKFKYGKELSPRGVECECTQKERSTSITKQLVFQYPFLP
jgi:hypothetical protein